MSEQPTTTATPPAPPAGPDLLVAADVRKEFGGLVAVSSVDFTIPEGSIVSLIGPNGAGKTTFFNMITGVYKPTGGTITFLGEDVTGKPPHAITERGIGRTFQNIRLFQNMTALENVLVGMHTRMHANLFNSILRTPGVRREERVAMIMLDTVDFPSVFLGAIRAGIVPVPLNTLLTSDQYAYVLADCRARVLFISEALLPVVKDMVGRMPDLEHVIVSGSDAHGHRKLSDELARESDSFTTAATHPDEPAFWLYSSGSTGAPKGTVHLHSHLIATAELYAKPILGIRESDVVFSAAKLFFAYGLGNALTFPMSVGATTVLMAERPTPVAVFTVKLPVPLIARVRAHAAASGRTISAVVTQALEEFLARPRRQRPRR